MRVLFFGTYDVDTHPRVLVLQEGFRDRGDDLVEVNAPLRIGTAQRVRMLREPWLVFGLVATIARRWWSLVRRSRGVGAVDLVVVGYLGHFDVLLARLLFRRRVIALDHLVSAADTALDRGERAAWKQRLLRRLDRAAVRAADHVIVDTDEHLALVPPPYRDRAIVVPVGASHAWFSAAGDDETGDALRVIFFGLYTPLQGAPTIGRALHLAGARDVPLRVTMVGSGQELEATRAAARSVEGIRWLDWVPASELPSLVARHDVCLGIFGAGPKALRVVPNKVYQGAAAGCAIVTSDTPPQRAALGDAAVYVAPEDPEALASALADLASNGARVAACRSAARDLAEARFRPGVVVTELRRKVEVRTC